MKAKLLALVWTLVWVAAHGQEPEFAAVHRGYELSFPRDFGAHPAFRTEWWYITGWLVETGSKTAKPMGFQITFFRVRTAADSANPSRFTPRQVLFAHAAISDPRVGRLLHEERIARAGFGLAEADVGDTRVWIRDWSLARSAERYEAILRARQFALDLAFSYRGSPMLQGDAGVSRKARDARFASYYYSQPQLAVSGRVEVRGESRQVTGTAWLDHEWSSTYLPAGAVGWDWVGANLADGGALMAFRMRGADGTVLWASANLRGGDGSLRHFGPEAVMFSPRRQWRSARSGAEYPVGMVLRVGDAEFAIEPLMDDQELDARQGTGTIYWEGAVRLSGGGRELGRGYLELTGYWRAMQM